MGEMEETCEWMAQAFVVAGEEVSAYGVQGLNDERMGVSEGEEHGATD